MAFKCREEIVGKRFLSISSSCKINVAKITASEWRAGVIRAASHSDPKNAELNVLVEYDDVDWKKREWIKVYQDNAFHIFLIESTLVWATREDPHSPGRKVQWPALIFSCLVDQVGLTEAKTQQIEFLSDKRIDVVDKADHITLFQSTDLEKHQLFHKYSEVGNAVKEWTEYQDGQRILLTTPSVLVGYRIEVYRAEGTTQWYTAVIISYNDNTKELTVTDDTVLEDHNEDPCLVQMKLIGDGVVQSILKGENVGITPRRRSCTSHNYQNNHHHTRTRSGHHHNTSTSHSTNINSKTASSAELQTSSNTSSSLSSKKARQPSSRTQNTQPPKPVLSDNIQSKFRRRRSSSENKIINSTKLSPKVVIEKFEDKPAAITPSVKKPTKKSSFEKGKKCIKKESNDKEDENLPPHVTESILITIESVVQNYQPSFEYQKDKLTHTKAEAVHVENQDNLSNSVKSDLDKDNEPTYQKSASDSSNLECNLSEENSDDSSVSPSSLSSAERFVNVDDSSPELITSSISSTNLDAQVKCNGECDNIDTIIEPSVVESMQTSDMECHTSNLVEQNLKPFSDDRQSDSGISEKLSSNRSSEGSSRSSGDERSISRSSESSRLSDTSDSAVPTSQAKSYKSSSDLPENKLSVSPLVFNKSEPIKVWRDPDLLNSSSQNIRHISSVQHNSMQHPNSNSQTGSSTIGYPGSLGGHHSAPPPGVAGHHPSPHQLTRPGTAPLPLTMTTPTTCAASQQLPLHSVLGPLSHHSQPTPFSTYGHSLMPAANTHPALMFQQYPLHPSADLINQPKYSTSTPWAMQQARGQSEYMHERDRLRRERQSEHVRHIAEWERNKINPDWEKEKAERIDNIVQQHFNESLQKLVAQKSNVVPNMPSSWNHRSNPASKTVPTSLDISHHHHHHKSKDVISAKTDSLMCDPMMYPGIASHYSQQESAMSNKKLLDEKLSNSHHLRQEANHVQSMEKAKAEAAALGYAASRSAMTTTSNALSAHTKPQASQASYSLYGYQPFQHSYITQDSAQRALVIGNSKSQGSITAGKPIERQSNSFDYKRSAEKVSPKSSKPLPSQRTNMQPSGSFDVSSITDSIRVGSHKNKEHWSPHQVAEKDSSKLKSSHHTLIQQGLVPNPLYTRTSGDPRPAHNAIDRVGQHASNALGPIPSPAHMSNSKPVHHLAVVPPRSVLSENNYSVMPQMVGHVPSNPSISSNQSVSSLPQGQPLDLQCNSSKRKSLEPENYSKKSKIQTEMPETEEALNLNINSNIQASTTLPTNAIISHKSTPPQQVVNLAASVKEIDDSVAQAYIDNYKSFIAANANGIVQNKTTVGQQLQNSVNNPVTTTSSPIKVSIPASSTNVTVTNTLPSSISTTSSSVNPTKLKKAWLQRHSGEDSSSSNAVQAIPTAPVVKPETLGSNSGSQTAINNSLPKKMYSKPTLPPPAKSPKASNIVFNGHVTESTSSSSDAEHDAANARKRSFNKSPKDAKKQRSSNDEQSENDKSNLESKPSPASSGTYEQPTKKRGRRPKGKASEEKKKLVKTEKEKPLPPPKVILDSVLQDKMCSEISTKLPKCRECRMTQNQRDKNLPNIFCRFYAFRRLRVGKSSTLSLAGFSEPNQASPEDLKLWLPRIDEPPSDLDEETAKCILSYVGDQFCDLVEQEREALSINTCEDKTVTWKRVVEGVREMCDVCETTLFNMHWVCPKCGFVVCVDCYKARKHRTLKEELNPPKDRDGYQWLFCSNKQVHDQTKLMMTQIIAGNALWEMSKRVHTAREKYEIPQHCVHCKVNDKDDKNSVVNRVEVDLIEEMRQTTRAILKDKQNGTSEKGDSKYGSESTTLGLLADVALNHKRQQDRKDSKEVGRKTRQSSDDSDNSNSNEEENYSTLRELLIRPHSESSNPPRPTLKDYRNNIKPVENLTQVIDIVIEQKIQTGQMTDNEIKEHRFRTLYPQCRYTREQIKPRAHFAKDSHIRFPKNPHSWWQSGKLLQLHDPTNKDNLRMFQESWKRGLPVVVSNVHKQMDMDLWMPKGFSRDFGHVQVDLYNCRSGTIISNQPSRVFWDGFDSFKKRLKDEETGLPAMLKLKDWPPSDDFREILPKRFADLMKALPLPYYTHRDGTHNLASRLPDCFVKPDLGPKMYIAYGLSKYPDTGTTNLHLDISDAINVMVYVGIPEDCEPDDPVKETFNTLDVDKDSMETKIVRSKAGALWHIYECTDADKIRSFLNKYAAEKGEILERHHDPIHDQSWYLDEKMRARLKEEYGVSGFSIVQCLGDCVFIPAGAPHQVQNLNSCIKVAEDFVSSENITHCSSLTQEFRYLSDTHTNHEDKLQIKNIIYHSIKDALAVIEHSEIKKTVES